MMVDNLKAQRRLRLNDILQAAMNQSAMTLRKMLGGELEIRIVNPGFRASEIRVQFGLTGALEGGFCLDLPEKMAIEMVKTLTGRENFSLLAEEPRSVLMEIGNILASVFVGHFDQNRGLRTLPTPPEISFVPLEMPEAHAFFSAELRWSRCSGVAEIFVGLQKSAIDMLLD